MSSPLVASTSLPLFKHVPVNNNGCRIVADGDSACFLASGATIKKINFPSLDDDIPEHTHENAVQSLHLVNKDKETTLASVDDKGHCIVSYRPESGDVKTVSFAAPATSLSYLSGSTCVVVDPADTSKIYTAQYWAKSISCFSAAASTPTRVIKTASHPTQMKYLSEKNVLVVAESKYISIFDLRQSERGGLANKLYIPPNEDIFALACKPQAIACGGSTRTTTFFDTRTWTIRNSWKACTKYQITSLHFSTTEEDKCYVTDDAVLLCNVWDEKVGQKSKNDYFGSSFRFDSRPLGVSLGISSTPKDEVMVGLTENGTVYYLRNWNHFKQKATEGWDNEVNLLTQGTGKESTGERSSPERKKRKVEQ